MQIVLAKRWVEAGNAATQSEFSEAEQAALKKSAVQLGNALSDTNARLMAARDARLFSHSPLSDEHRKAIDTLLNDDADTDESEAR